MRREEIQVDVSLCCYSEQSCFLAQIVRPRPRNRKIEDEEENEGEDDLVAASAALGTDAPYLMLGGASNRRRRRFGVRNRRKGVLSSFLLLPFHVALPVAVCQREQLPAGLGFQPGLVLLFFAPFCGYPN
jgi:hypothetical protein